MAKKVKVVIKLAAPGGAAVPGQKLGPVLGSAGVNIMAFCTDFNAKSKHLMGMNVPCILTVFDDRTFSIVLKQPPVYDLIKKELGITIGSGKPNKLKIGNITKAQIEKIAKQKIVDMNTTNIESAKKIVEGSAKSMGLVVVE